MKIYCIVCKNATNHKILNKQMRIYGDAEQGEERWSIEWQIIECQGCNNISGRELRTYEGDTDPETGEQYEHEILFPKRGENLLAIKSFLNLPILLRPIYRETIDAFNNQSFILCSAGLRALIEGICKEFNIKEGPLELQVGTTTAKRKKNLIGRIAGLHERGLLTKSHADILHEHRFLGNEALHGLQTPTLSELKIAIEIIEHTIENLFEIHQKAETLRDSKKSRGKKTIFNTKGIITQ